MSKRVAGWGIVALMLTAAHGAIADPATTDLDGAAAKAADPNWAIHVQATDVLQYHPAFNSPYQGTNSLKGTPETANTVDASIIAGFRPWKGAQIWFDEDMN